MSEIKIRDNSCENCAKFSHCNNNDLVCIRKFQQLKAENKELVDILRHTQTYLEQCEIAKEEHFFEGIDRTNHEVEKNTLLALCRKLKEYKAENEELRNIQLGFCQGEKLFNLYEYSKCLDKIEEIIKELINCGCLDLYDCIDELNAILQLIKQVKGVGSDDESED